MAAAEGSAAGAPLVSGAGDRARALLAGTADLGCAVRSRPDSLLPLLGAAGPAAARLELRCCVLREAAAEAGAKGMRRGPEGQRLTGSCRPPAAPSLLLAACPVLRAHLSSWPGCPVPASTFGSWSDPTFHPSGIIRVLHRPGFVLGLLVSSYFLMERTKDSIPVCFGVVELLSDLALLKHKQALCFRELSLAK